MEARLIPERKLLTVVDTYAGCCEVCHEPRVVGRMAVTGWEFHGAICSGCLTGLAEQVQQRQGHPCRNIHTP